MESYFNLKFSELYGETSLAACLLKIPGKEKIWNQSILFILTPPSSFSSAELVHLSFGTAVNTEKISYLQFFAEKLPDEQKKAALTEGFNPSRFLNFFLPLSVLTAKEFNEKANTNLKHAGQ